MKLTHFKVFEEGEHIDYKIKYLPPHRAMNPKDIIHNTIAYAAIPHMGYIVKYEGESLPTKILYDCAPNYASFDSRAYNWNFVFLNYWHAFAYMMKCMTTAPDWCKDIPLNAEGGFDVRYSK